MNLQEIKIVTDSSSDTLNLDNTAFASAPLKIVTNEKEYVDDANLDVEKMVEELASYNGKSSTACPSPNDWLEAFSDAQYVICVSITSNLSGSYNAACIAKQLYEEKHPERKVFILDSLSAGPEIRLVLEKLREYITELDSFDEICQAVTQYLKTTALLFMLESMKNLANNGRVNPLVAKVAGLFGIRAVGKASEVGTLELLEKSRGEAKALSAIVTQMKKLGMKGGRVRISHCFNENAANTLKNMILAEFKDAQIEIYSSRGLCSFYAEKGGMLVGFERS